MQDKIKQLIEHYDNPNIERKGGIAILANKCGVSWQTVKAWSQGREPQGAARVLINMLYNEMKSPPEYLLDTSTIVGVIEDAFNAGYGFGYKDHGGEDQYDKELQKTIDAIKKALEQ